MLATAFDAGVLGTEPGAAETLAREQALFAARRRTLDEQVASLRAQIGDAQAQVQALGSQVAATEASGKLATDELEINEKLVAQGFIQRTRLLALQRDASDYRSKIGEHRSDLALARQRIGDLQLRIAQARNQYQAQAADELRESAARLRELDERLRPTLDTAERQVLRAPVDGEVMNLKVSARGQAIGPREPVLDVVPDREALIVEARIRPQDIDQVQRGSRAEVRIDAFDARTTPMLAGRVTFVSPDRVTSSDGRDAWFVANVEVDMHALPPSASPLALRPGMAAELYVATGERSLFEYLAKPLGLFARRAMRER
jgi:HlyD family type I secretion membrane fusion protein